MGLVYCLMAALSHHHVRWSALNLVTSSLDTQKHILLLARSCFFQHGYKASNMSMISQYAGFSRATIHKYFKNKDHVFRSVCRQIQQQSNEACAPLLDRKAEPCWQRIGLALEVWLKPTFEEVNDQLILRDLKFHAQSVAEDIFNEAHEDLHHLIQALIDQGLEQKLITLKALNMDSSMLSHLIVAGMDGLRSHFECQEVQKGVQHLLTVFKQATIVA